MSASINRQSHCNFFPISCKALHFWLSSGWNMGKDYLGKDQRSTKEEDKEEKPIQGL